MNKDTNNFSDTILINNKKYIYFNLVKAAKKLGLDLQKLPFTYRILLENILRQETNDLKNLKNLLKLKHGKEIFFYPSRVLMQDYTGVPAIADLAAMRDRMSEKNKDPELINPIVPVSLVIDHSISVDSSSQKKSLEINVKNEFLKNKERYQILKWAQNSLKNFTLFPPGSGICHQINIEYISDIVAEKNNLLYFDSVVGTDSHTTMVNALSILGWGVGGIEAEAVMLGQPISLKLPEVIGVKLSGKLNDGLTATDLVLTITEKLRKINVVGKFVEFFGDGIENLSLSERSTISNMAPEYGATCGFFPVDNETLKYLKITGRDKNKIKVIENFCKKQKMWHEKSSSKILYNKVLKINLNQIKASLAGPKRPQDRIELSKVKENFTKSLSTSEKNIIEKQKSKTLTHGKVCIAAITSCTNTSNPAVLIMAGLVARKARKYGLSVPNWVKTSFAPGSKVVETYMKEAGLQNHLDELGFNIIGYGCTTCIGNSGPLAEKISDLITKNDLNVCSVISGNRNFEGRIHPLIKSNYLASPPLVVMYALAGKVDINFSEEEISIVKGKKIFFKDLWPSVEEVKKTMNKCLKSSFFKSNYANIFDGDLSWKKIKADKSPIFRWSMNSTYIKKPPFLEKRDVENNINNARPLLVLGDSITTDHISPAGVIKKNSATAKYLSEHQVSDNDFNSYGARRGNHEVMVRGTFANIRIRNMMVDKAGGYTKHYPSNFEGEIFEISEKYKKKGVPLVVIAGKEYGTGSSRDWAAKGTRLLGIRVVIAESFERIHRSNLVGMGVLPLQMENISLLDLKLKGSETFDIGNIDEITSRPGMKTDIKINYENRSKKINVLSRIDTEKEIKYFKSDGILPCVLKEIEANIE